MSTGRLCSQACQGDAGSGGDCRVQPDSERVMKPISPTVFIDRVLKLNEKGLPWKLSPYQRRVLELAFRRDPDGALLYRQVVLSEPKKSGKTFIAACLALWWALITDSTEIIIVANDREQSI